MLCTPLMFGPLRPMIWRDQQEALTEIYNIQRCRWILDWFGPYICSLLSVLQRDASISANTARTVRGMSQIIMISGKHWVSSILYLFGWQKLILYLARWTPFCVKIESLEGGQATRERASRGHHEMLETLVFSGAVCLEIHCTFNRKHVFYDCGNLSFRNVEK